MSFPPPPPPLFFFWGKTSGFVWVGMWHASGPGRTGSATERCNYGSSVSSTLTRAFFLFFSIFFFGAVLHIASYAVWVEGRARWRIIVPEYVNGCTAALLTDGWHVFLTTYRPLISHWPDVPPLPSVLLASFSNALTAKR